MPTIEIANRVLLLNVVHHDSGEQPESDNTNVLIGAKVGNVTYQYLNISLQDAIKRIAAKIEAAARLYSMDSVPPQMLTVVVSRFNQETSINWKSAEGSVYETIRQQ